MVEEQGTVGLKLLNNKYGGMAYMKINLTMITLLMSFTSLFAQTETLKHFEISASVNLWTPTSLHLKTSGSVTQYHYPDGTYVSMGALSGYGTSLAPGFNVAYFFNNKIGISLGFYIVHMDNELFVQETDSTFSSYENIAEIPNFILGISGKNLSSKSLQMFYETGINVIPAYNLEMRYGSNSSNPPDMDAYGSALGVYGKTGVNVKILKLLSFKTGLMYSYIPAELEYTNSEASAKINEKTNLGGIGLETGLSFNF